jgi:LuxR family transcriptional regulator, maltose regulon positive regulatory protein
MGEVVTARHLLREVDDVLRHRPRLGTLVDETAQVRDLVASAPSGAGSPPLSPAELRVLPYLPTHLTFEEIAERLFVSRNTVRSHARAIYQKLGVSSRGEAVAAATAVGLLGDPGVGVTA